MKLNKKQKYHQSIIPGHGIGSKVVNHDLNFALRMWKRKLKSSDVLTKLKENNEYIKPSRIKRTKKMAAIYKQQMDNLKEQ
mgnify:CR=1 FL=1